MNEGLDTENLGYNWIDGVWAGTKYSILGTGVHALATHGFEPAAALLGVYMAAEVVKDSRDYHRHQVAVDIIEQQEESLEDVRQQLDGEQ